jgi:hypothetical protein
MAYIYENQEILNEYLGMIGGSDIGQRVDELCVALSNFATALTKDAFGQYEGSPEEQRLFYLLLASTAYATGMKKFSGCLSHVINEMEKVSPDSARSMRQSFPEVLF